jgi:hypothetical protein
MAYAEMTGLILRTPVVQDASRSIQYSTRSGSLTQHPQLDPTFSRTPVSGQPPSQLASLAPAPERERGSHRMLLPSYHGCVIKQGGALELASE